MIIELYDISVSRCCRMRWPDSQAGTCITTDSENRLKSSSGKFHQGDCQRAITVL